MLVPSVSSGSFSPVRRQIRQSGGVAVLAHPLQYHYPRNEVIEFIEYGVSLGVQALECYYSEHSADEQAWLLSLAERYGLGISGGSDWHGSRKTWIAMGSGTGNMCVPYSVLEGLKSIKN